jgi:HEAT repeat protein
MPGRAIQNGAMSQTDGSSPASAKPRRRRRSGVAALLVLVAACAVWMAVGRDTWRDYHDPARVVARQLQSADGETRLEAAADLARFSGAPSGFALLALRDALDDPDARVRARAASSLGPMIGAAMRSGSFVPEARDAGARLVGAMRDEDPDVRVSVMIALAGAAPGGADPDRIVAELSRALFDPEPSVRKAAVSIMLSIARAVPASASSQLVSALDSDSVEARTNAATIVAAFQSGTDDAIPALFRAVEQTAPGRAATGGPDIQAAWGALQAIRPTAGAVPYLRQRLADPRPDLRAVAAAMLGRVGGEADAATPDLIALLMEPPPAIVDDPASSAAVALGQIGAKSARSQAAIVAALIELVRSGTASRRIAAASGLVAIRNENYHSHSVSLLLAAAAPVVTDALRESLATRPTRGEVEVLIRALGAVAPGTQSASTAVEVLAEALRSDRPEVVDAALRGLPPFKADAQPALDLVRSLRDDPSHRQVAELILSILEPVP